jgi:thiol-disulfide isomerase/thioredoxin
MTVSQMVETKKKIILYSADWCVPCQQLKEKLDILLKDKPVELLVVDVDKEGLDGHNIERVPRLCFIKQSDEKCDGVADCVEGSGKVTLEKVRKFVESD